MNCIIEKLLKTEFYRSSSKYYDVHDASRKEIIDLMNEKLDENPLNHTKIQSLLMDLFVRERGKEGIDVQLIKDPLEAFKNEFLFSINVMKELKERVRSIESYREVNDHFNLLRGFRRKITLLALKSWKYCREVSFLLLENEKGKRRINSIVFGNEDYVAYHLGNVHDDEKIISSFHTHPGWLSYPSLSDLDVEALHNHPEAVIDPKTGTVNVYTWIDGVGKLVIHRDCLFGNYHEVMEKITSKDHYFNDYLKINHVLEFMDECKNTMISHANAINSFKIMIISLIPFLTLGQAMITCLSSIVYFLASIPFLVRFPSLRELSTIVDEYIV